MDKKTLGWVWFLLAIAGRAQADYALNLTKGVTEISRIVYGFHVYALWICLGIAIVVFGVMIYSIINFRKSNHPKPATFHENTWLEIVWSIVPALILVAIAVPATKALIQMEDTSGAEMTIKVTGYQWKWHYEYFDDPKFGSEGIQFFSSLDEASNRARQLGSDIDPESVSHYLLNVDHPLVIPINTKIRFLFTAADVIHAWWVPDFGWKKDAIPGFVTAAWAEVKKPGIYRGQCAELCGRDHGFMPIVVKAVKEDEFKKWVAEQKAKQAKITSGKLSEEELLARGREVYNAQCAACHQVDGSGLPGTFPSLKESSIVKGDLDGFVKLVLEGRGAMPAFGENENLSNTDLAAALTYVRQEFGGKRDRITPEKVSEKRGE